MFRVLAYVICFIENAKIKLKTSHQTGKLNSQSLLKARVILIRFSQSILFFNEIKSITRVGQVPNKSKLLALNPFLDENGILCSHSRLANSQFPLRNEIFNNFTC